MSDMQIFFSAQVPVGRGRSDSEASVNPVELPKMVAGLRVGFRTHIQWLELKMEESGEHVVFGTVNCIWTV
jgi:hypothetical protein